MRHWSDVPTDLTLHSWTVQMNSTEYNLSNLLAFWWQHKAIKIALRPVSDDMARHNIAFQIL